jgi:NADPH:quinone reductase-like Zn-dependent oxidoreductase
MAKTTAPTPDQPGRWVVSRFGPPSVLEWHVFDALPTPKDDEVLIAILAAGISGTDNLQRVGGHPDPRVSSPGFTPGHDFVGEVVALGAAAAAVPAAGSRRLAVGDRVAAMCMCGAYATHIVLPATVVLPLRATDDPVRFAALPLNYMTAYGLLTQSAAASALQAPGTSVLIGSVAGGIGTAVAQLARAFDMRLTLFGTCSPGKFDYVRALGVTPIDRRRAADDVAAQVRALTGGAGVDVAFDAVGSEASLRASFAATKVGTGVLVGVGAMASIAADGSGLRPGCFDTLQFLRSGALPRSSFFAMSLSYYAGARDVWLQDFEKVAQAVRDGKLDPAIGKLLPLSEAVRANEMLVTGEGVTGKMEFVVDAELAKAKGII